ncbi:MAG: hypothetical protein KF889_15025 [Alphaproteobacteria bacterium]|nr:hypothetical protein [Alphaproteobacteria bacterium]MCW5744538.1 hypothetical protein [Alphaproteobacteria bacterium]
MKSLAGAAVIAVFLAGPAWGLSERACSRIWTKADTDGDGVLKGAEASDYLAAIRRDGRVAPANGHIRRPRFMHHCRVGVYEADRGKVALSEAQAKSLAAAAGYRGMTEMVREADGTWHGTVTIGHRTIEVRVDPDGNVVAEPVASTAFPSDPRPAPWDLG